MDTYADYRYFERELRSIRQNLRRREFEFQQQLPPKAVSRKSVPEPETTGLGSEIEKVLYQCELCEELFVDGDLVSIL
jgi:hypothetical protein